ncbi:MAG: exosortase-associated EpsI family protein [Desulfuromonadales bacterium]|nr:exosortase-associated EpsI family protein [Desulfuromonadales bacterium]
MGQIKPYRFYILYVLLALAAVYVLTRSEAAIPVNKPFELFPQKIGEWRMVGQDQLTNLTNEYGLKLATAKNAILNNRRDSSFIRLSIPATENEDLARQKGAQFIQAFFPAISATLPH